MTACGSKVEATCRAECSLRTRNVRPTIVHARGRPFFRPHCSRPWPDRQHIQLRIISIAVDLLDEHNVALGVRIETDLASSDIVGPFRSHAAARCPQFWTIRLGELGCHVRRLIARNERARPRNHSRKVAPGERRRIVEISPGEGHATQFSVIAAKANAHLDVAGAILAIAGSPRASKKVLKRAAAYGGARRRRARIWSKILTEPFGRS